MAGENKGINQIAVSGILRKRNIIKWQGREYYQVKEEPG
jgi:hypothetical protein